MTGTANACRHCGGPIARLPKCRWCGMVVATVGEAADWLGGEEEEAERQSERADHAKEEP